MPAPDISVVLPFHNAGATLPRALESIQQQTCQHLEIICVDDGSRDDGADIVRHAATGDARIRLCQPGRVGLVEALATGCAEANGPFIARMDADDIALPARLEKQLALLRGNPQMGLCGTQVRIVGPAARIGAHRYQHWLNALTSPELVAREIFIECPVAHPAFLLRREAYESVGGYVDLGWAEDYDLVLRLHAAGWAMANVSEVLLLWCDTHDRLSRRDRRYCPEAFRACKRYYLLAGPFLTGRAFYQWGAGQVGKRWLREWGPRKPEAVIDINVRKIGSHIHGYAVLPPAQLPPPGEVLALVAVGAPGARDEIRAWCASHGYVEGADFLFIA